MESIADAHATTVLIVDDEPVNRLVLSRMAEHFGARIMEAASGSDALEMLRAQPVDLVLMDIHMPQMSGLEVVERLRAAPGPNRETPVVAVTGDTTLDEREYVALGFDAFASKPISLAGVEAMLKTRRAWPAPSLRAGGSRLV
jgi:CheY-like chemotaxis protein